METYTLTVQNNSGQSGDFCIFQETPDLNSPHIQTLAWLAKPANPSSSLSFEWSLDYNFVWGQSDNLVPTTTQKVKSNTSITLIKKNSTHELKNHTIKKTENNALHITSNKVKNSNKNLVGIGMSGAGTFLLKSDQDLDVHIASPKQYKVCFGDYKQGQILNPSQLANLGTVVFPPNVYNMEIKLNPDSTWAIVPVK